MRVSMNADSSRHGPLVDAVNIAKYTQATLKKSKVFSQFELLSACQRAICYMEMSVSRLI
jgi:hypothetical protein